MCQAWNEEKIVVAISSTIEAWRDVNIPDSEIREKIISKYNLTEEEATSYMRQRTA